MARYSVDHTWLNNILVVLVEPQYSGNIAACARVLAVNGLSQLHLVEQKDPRLFEETPWWLAWGAEDILNSAVHWTHLKDCISDCIFVVGCAHRKRRRSGPIVSPRAAALRLAEESAHGPVALVFGSERTGLHSEHLDLCHVRSEIPQKVEQPSYNLSHAVAIYAYELTQVSGPVKHPSTRSAPTVSSSLALREHLETVISLVGPAPARLSNDIYRLWLRARPSEAEMRLLHRLLQLTERWIKRNSSENRFGENGTITQR